MASRLLSILRERKATGRWRGREWGRRGCLNVPNVPMSQCPNVVELRGCESRRSPALAPWAVAAALAASPALLRRWNLGGPAPAPDDVVFSVAGMKCEGCAAGLRQAVLDRLGASSAGRVSVDFERAQITVGGVQREVASAAIGAAAAERDYDVASEAGV